LHHFNNNNNDDGNVYGVVTQPYHYNDGTRFYNSTPALDSAL